jgi:exosortase D (VPLPA-CTERM-specific)
MAFTPSHSAGSAAGAVALRDFAGLALFAALVAFAGIYFQPGLVALAEAWRLPEYSHGPLIPILSGVLFLRQLKQEPVTVGPIDDRWPGVIVVALALLLGAVGKIARIPDIVAYAMIGFVAGLILISLGWRRGRRYWPAVVHLAFMLPLPGILYWKVSTYLQFVSSELGVALIRLAGVPVFLDGNIIDLGVYKLHVAEACSGLRYLYPILSFSYIFATLYRGPNWHKAVLLVSAAPITVVMNSVRIGIIGVIVDNFGLAHVEGITHLLEGWVIFLTSVVILFGMARLMLALQRDTHMSLSEALDLDLSGQGAQIARLRFLRASGAAFVALALTAGAVVGWSALPPREAAVIERAPLALFPTRLDGWRNTVTNSLEPEVARALGADDYFSAQFVNPDHPAYVDVFVAWYRDQTRGGIHSPEVCLPGSGWEMAEIARTTVDLGGARVVPVPLNRAIIQKGESRLLVYYWFEQYGGRTASDYAAKAALLRDGVVHGRTDGALVRIITPILPGETEADAEARLRSATNPVVDALPRFVPSLDAARRAAETAAAG